MRISIFIFFCFALWACDSNRVFEENTDFEKRYWISNESPSFSIQIPDNSIEYSIKVNFRNSVAYPKANLYYQFTLLDSAGVEIEKKLLNNFLFDEKTGEPFGSTGLGDIFDHQFPVLENYKFRYNGKYEIQLQQYMRMDTLPGILSAGVRVEKFTAD